MPSTGRRLLTLARHTLAILNVLLMLEEPNFRVSFITPAYNDPPPTSSAARQVACRGPP